MARANKTDKADEDSGTIKPITAKEMKDLLKECRAFKADIDEISGQMGGAVKAAVETRGLNRKMFAWVRQLDRMEPEKIAMHLEDLEHYLKISGVMKKAESAPSFDDAPKSDAASDSVVPLRSGNEAHH